MPRCAKRRIIDWVVLAYSGRDSKAMTESCEGKGTRVPCSLGGGTDPYRHGVPGLVLFGLTNKHTICSPYGPGPKRARFRPARYGAPLNVYKGRSTPGGTTRDHLPSQQLPHSLARCVYGQSRHSILSLTPPSSSTPLTPLTHHLPCPRN